MTPLGVDSLSSSSICYSINTTFALQKTRLFQPVVHILLVGIEPANIRLKAFNCLLEWPSDRLGVELGKKGLDFIEISLRRKAIDGSLDDRAECAHGGVILFVEHGPV